MERGKWVEESVAIQVEQRVTLDFTTRDLWNLPVVVIYRVHPVGDSGWFRVS